MIDRITIRIPEPLGAWVRPAILDTIARALAIFVVATLSIGSWHDVWQASTEDPTQLERDRRETDEGTAAVAPVPTKEVIVGAYGGLPYSYPSDVRLLRDPDTDLNIKGVQWRGEPFDDPIYYGARVQNWFEGGRTGVMIDFTHSKAIAELEKSVEAHGTIDGNTAPQQAKLKDFFKKLEFSHGHNMLTLNGLMRLRDLHPRLSPYVGVGAGINLPHTEIGEANKSRDKRTYEYQYTGPNAQALIGLEFRLRHISVFVEYKFTFAHYDAPVTEQQGTRIGLFADLARQYQRWWSGITPPGGFLSTTVASHQLVGGFGVRFARHPNVQP